MRERIMQPIVNKQVITQSASTAASEGSPLRERSRGVRLGMASLVRDMLSGTYTTAQLLDIFRQYTPQQLTVEEVAGCMDGVFDTASYIINAQRYEKPVVVPAGTGGDGKGTVNITTMAGFVMAASGECVVPLYGNRKASGKFGKMDVLEALGLTIDLTAGDVHELLSTTGIAPVFARTVYPGASHVAQARVEFGAPTLFNVTMPQAAPVTSDAALFIGSSKEDQLENMGKIAAARGVKRAMFVHNQEHQLDEIATGRNKLVIVQNGKIQTLDLSIGTKEDIALLQAAEPADFVRLFQQVLDPSYKSAQLDAIRRVVAMNAACGLFLAKGSNDFAREFSQYYTAAYNIIQSGKAKEKLDELREIYK